MTNQTITSRSHIAPSPSFMHEQAESSTSGINNNNTTIPATTTTSGSNDPSPNGTLYYSLDQENEASRKRSTRHDLDCQEGSQEGSSRKQQRAEEEEGGDEFKAPISPASASSEIESCPSLTRSEDSVFTHVEPDWVEHPGCWAFLQSLRRQYANHYLMKKTGPKSNRAGWVIGRDKDTCDVVIDRDEISRNHALIYMETGSNGVAKGIRIYLEDKSFNGTFVNGTKIGRNRRVMLRNGDIIQLFHAKRPFYRVCFPPMYEANTCEHDYYFQSELGKGNFATVYHANHYQTNEEVAIKVMQKGKFVNKPRLLQSMIQEIGIMMHIEKHPFVIQIKEVYNEQSRIFLVMEYARDRELFKLIQDNKKLSEDDTRFVFWQLFTAIDYLHSRNIAHRDLKPENIILANASKLHIKVSDFGLAKTKDRDQAFDSQCGTPNYVAPEVLDPTEVRGYGTQCDLWSLGVMLYICLCGYPPFSDDNGPPSMKSQIKMGKYSFGSPYWDNISSEAKDMIKLLLEVDPDARMTASEALDHQWMHMNAEDVDHRKNELGREVLADIARLSKRVSIAATQEASSQSLSLSFGNY